MSAPAATRKSARGQKGMGMEGGVVRWYARNTGKNMEAFRTLARSLADRLDPTASVLEVAPGPGYLAVELAKLGPFRVVGLDISKTFVEIARTISIEAGISVDFQLGDASAMPFAADSFDLIVCRAAFKNFADPVGALAEMYRVLTPGGQALIFDLRPDASRADIRAEVAGMNLSWWNSRSSHGSF